jgi:hypothetical protein
VELIVEGFHIVSDDHFIEGSNIHFHDRIIEIYLSCLVDFVLHYEILGTFQMIQTCASLGRCIHIYSSHR